MWKYASCHKKIISAVKDCPYCKKQTKIPSNIILAYKDETNLKKRFKNFKKSLNSKEQDWQKILKCEGMLKKLISVSINMHTESLLNLLHDERIRYLNLHDIAET